MTLVEILIGVTLLAIILALVAPSLRDLLAAQRVRSINAELVTDLQFARSEAVRRGRPVLMSFRSSTATTCYTIYLPGAEVCNCLLGVGKACNAPDQEIKTVSVSRRVGVTLTSSRNILFETTGVQADTAPGTPAFAVTVASAERGALRTSANATGRPSVCSPQGAFREVPACVD